MNEKLFSFKMPDGTVEFMSIKDAIALNNDHIAARVEEIMLNLKNKRMVKDGFEAGWQENIQMYVGGRREYDRVLKEKGLVEIGYEAIPKDSTTTSNPCASLDFALYAKDELGVELTSNEIEAIASGEYFSPDKCDATPEKD